MQVNLIFSIHTLEEGHVHLASLD